MDRACPKPSWMPGCVHSMNYGKKACWWRIEANLGACRGYFDTQHLNQQNSCCLFHHCTFDRINCVSSTATISADFVAVCPDLNGHCWTNESDPRTSRRNLQNRPLASWRRHYSTSSGVSWGRARVVLANYSPTTSLYYK